MATRAGTYKAAVVPKAGAAFEVRDVPFRALKPNEALIKVEACGSCHSDSVTKEGHMPITYPRVPGHEVVGVIEELGEGVPASRGFKVGLRVGRGWHGGHCWGCDSCSRGDFILCAASQISGVSDDGGYAEYMYATWESLAIVPAGLPSIEAGPLMCAGVTVYNSLRNMKVPPPALVAVLGIGGLGHLAIQFAAKSGYTVAAVGRGTGKADAAKQLGATHWIDNSKGDAAQQLQALGGAAVIIATATDSKTTSGLIPGLAPRGVILVIGLGQGPIEVNAVDIIMQRRTVQGWPSGTAWDSQETMQFAFQHRIKTVVETFPLAKAEEAYNHMMSGKARYRAVIIP